MEHLKFSVFGGSGNIGQAVRRFLQYGTFPLTSHVELMLISPNNERRMVGRGFDMKEAQRNLGIKTPLTVTTSSDASHISGSKAVFICAGAQLKPKDFADYLALGIDDRQAQSYKNLGLIKEICSDIMKYCTPETLVFVITNQVDMMTEITKMELPDYSVYGMGCGLDTVRFREILTELLDSEEEHYDEEVIDSLYMIGRHNNTMFPYPNSLVRKFKPEIIEKAVLRTRARGGEISLLSTNIHEPDKVEGAYEGPATMIVRAIAGLCGGKSYKTPLARPIRPIEFEDYSGLNAQLLNQISNGTVCPVLMPMDETDKANLRECMEKFAEMYDRFFQDLSNIAG